jgi:indole-3-glycerol phosphate synthase
MSPLLQGILAASHARTEERAKVRPQSELERMIADLPPRRSLQQALSGRFSVIAEHKRRSPSGGDMNALNLERALGVYAETPWISAVSVLTDEDHFKGSIWDLQAARAVCGERPILRKDFIVDEYQVYEAAAFGADAILLMATLHAEDPARLQRLFQLTQELQLDALLEIGMGSDDPENLAKIVPQGAKIWGINARTFGGVFGVRAALSRLTVSLFGKDLRTHLSEHKRLRKLIPAGCLAVAESGIHHAKDLSTSRAAGYDAALIGTAFLKGPRSIEDVIADLNRCPDLSAHSPIARTA